MKKTGGKELKEWINIAINNLPETEEWLSLVPEFKSLAASPSKTLFRSIEDKSRQLTHFKEGDAWSVKRANYDTALSNISAIIEDCFK